MTVPVLPSEPASTGAPARDSLFAERVRWTGTPKQVIASPLHRAMAWLLGTFSAISTLLAIAGSQAGHGSTGKLVIFAAWTASVALAVRMLPVLFAQAARFTVTDRHVIWQGGKLKRTMQRAGISFARITWHKNNPHVGDIDLVRAVPTGALRRRLTLTFEGVAAPHRVWSIVRGAQTLAGQEGGGNVPPEERLDAKESVRWTGSPTLSWRAWLPLTTRRTLTAALGLLCWMFALRSVLVGLPVLERLLDGGIPLTSLAFLCLAASILLTVAALVTLGIWFLHVGITRKPWMDRKTRYLVTNQRLILLRGRRELHVDRSAIVDVVDRNGLYGERDAYLILDGPHSRAVSAQGVFGPGERVRGFRPMLQGLTKQELQALRQELVGKSPD